MPKEEVSVSGYNGGTFQEIRFTLCGGGPTGLEIVVRSENAGGGISVKFWHPFNHEWVTPDPNAFIYHGNTSK